MVSKTKSNFSILIGRCSCDLAVRYPFYWANEIVDEAKLVGANIIDLKDENFIEDKFSEQILKYNPKFVFLNGHGDEYSAKGYNKINVLIANENDYLLNKKVAHILSCHTGSFLAQSAMDKGCLGYIGYRDYFYIWFLEEKPEIDIISKMFKDAVNIVSITLLNGGSVREAFDKSQKIYEKYIEECKGRYLNPNVTEQKDYLQEVIGALLKNKKHQVHFSLEE